MKKEMPPAEIKSDELGEQEQPTYLTFEEARKLIGFPKTIWTFRRRLKEAQDRLNKPIPPQAGYLLFSQVIQLNETFIELEGIKRGIKK
jgi:hypothetical protein